MRWKIPYIDFKRQYQKQEKSHLKNFKQIMQKGDFVLRGEVEKFEKNVAKYLGVKYVVSVNSCTDAILLTLGSLGFLLPPRLQFMLIAPSGAVKIDVFPLYLHMFIYIAPAGAIKTFVFPLFPWILWNICHWSRQVTVEALI